ncbi:MAG: 3-isopropylmalate dehydratase small subunit [Bacteroidales bacterium]|nr:3-isopropylmalate dehydratase small subunit [Bacteroidales bacterium]
MEKNNITISKAVVFKSDNIDTDKIIPARFLKAVNRGDFGDKLFCDLRTNPNFCINQYTGNRKILIAGNNFGCGSSREHAVWALYDYGFRVIIATGFADIFKNNAYNNGLCPLIVSQKCVDELAETAVKNKDSMFEVNIESQYIKNYETNTIYNFDIEQFRKECLINGFDNTSWLLSMKDDIIKYETTRNQKYL